MTQLKRYTELPYVLQILETRKITLLNPSSWDDKNDSYFVQVYKEKKGHGSVLALCLTGAQQTYHHWRVFTSGSSGACICFNRSKFLDWLEEQEVLAGREIDYRSLPQIKRAPPKLEDLPYIKRRAYIHEDEFRLVYATARKSVASKAFDFPLDMIDYVVLNPWLPASTANAVESIIKRIDGGAELDVIRATIVSNDEWQAAATKGAEA